MDRLNAVLGDYLSVNLLLASEYSLANARDEHLIARFIVEFNILSDGERYDTPVDTVRAIALCSILVADVGVATEHLLAAGSLLACLTVARTISEYA